MNAKPLSRNEMHARAIAARWKDETSEKAESQTFWTEFLGIYSVDRKRVAALEQLAKHTSTGKDLSAISYPLTQKENGLKVM
jgi:hypothetical protein